MAQCPFWVSTKLRYSEVVFSVSSDDHKGIFKENKNSTGTFLLLCKQEEVSCEGLVRCFSVF